MSSKCILICECLNVCFFCATFSIMKCKADQIKWWINQTAKGPTNNLSVVLLGHVRSFRVMKMPLGHILIKCRCKDGRVIRRSRCSWQRRHLFWWRCWQRFRADQSWCEMPLSLWRTGMNNWTQLLQIERWIYTETCVCVFLGMTLTHCHRGNLTGGPTAFRTIETQHCCHNH